VGFSVLAEGLEDALSLLHADRGNVQIADPITGSLVLVMHTGFSDEFLEYFAVVDDDGSACGRAAAQHAQTVIGDVTTDPGFAPHREIAAASRFRAVQSTPLMDLSGQLVGMLSTHYPRPYRPSDRDLGLMRRLGVLIGEAFETSLDANREAAFVSSQ
jgi:GAF domain-containing protein